MKVAEEIGDSGILLGVEEMGEENQEMLENFGSVKGSIGRILGIYRHFGKKAERLIFKFG